MKKLVVNEPCHENWNKMTPDEKGRFCDICSKSVHDFTNKKDQEIIKVIENSSEGVCGRFRKSQLNREIIDYQPIVMNKMSVMGALLLVGGFTISNAVNSDFETGQVEIIGKPLAETVLSNIQFKGVVLDALSKQSVPYCAISVYRGEELFKIASANDLGEFEMDVFLESVNDVRLEVHHQGYETSVTNIDEEEVESLEIELSRNSQEELFIKGDTIVEIEEFIVGELEMELGDVAVECTVDESHIKEDLPDCPMPEVDIPEVDITYTAPDLIYPDEFTEVYVLGMSTVGVRATNEIEFNQELEVENIIEENDEIQLFPNPAGTSITIKTSIEGDYQISVYNAAGALVQSREFFGTQVDLNITELERGFYFVNILDLNSKEIRTKKLIKR